MFTIAAVLIIVAILCLLGGLNASPAGFNITRKRKQADPSNRPAVLDVAATLSIVATKLRVTTPIPCSLNGIPQYYVTGGTHTGNELPTAAVAVSPTTFDLTFPTSVIATNVAHLVQRDPAIRGFNGAYVQPQTATL